jgi:hypothetical protein
VPADDERSDVALPLPVVLVVGDDSSYFSSQVWDGAQAALDASGPETAPIPWPVIRDYLSGEESHIDDFDLARHPRPRTRTPVPLQVVHPHNPNVAELKQTLQKLLDLFDVWGIIASASAGDVQPLRTALKGIDIPLLVTTASTTVPVGMESPNELRLMPSNRSQATTLLFAATRARDPVAEEDSVSPMREPPDIAFASGGTSQARQYINNLSEQLKEAAATLGINLSRWKEQQDHAGPLIVIGYEDYAESFIKNRPARRLTILSDGCATRGVRDMVLAERGQGQSSSREPFDDVAYWFVSRPGVSLRTLGQQSFSAIAEAGYAVLTSDWKSVSKEDPGSRTSWRDMIKDILEQTDRSVFQFEGFENVAPSYSVTPIHSAPDFSAPGSAGRRQTRRPSTQRFKVLRS